jgi:Family of unknown function (DUF6152)
MNPKACCLPAAMIISCAIPAAAHHSFAMFDRDKTVEMQGTVKAFQWTNPHSFLDVYVEDLKGGAPVLWTLEFGSVHNLINQGWRPKALTPGDKVLFTLHPAKDGAFYGQALTVTLPNGTVMQAVQGLLPADFEQPRN